MTPLAETTFQFSAFAVLSWMLLAFAAGAAAAYTSRQTGELRRIERKLDALLKHQGVSQPPPASLSAEAQLIARDPSRKIEAIKLHREQTGVGLAEAKADVESFMKTLT